MMRCPSCKQSDDLEICCTTVTNVYVDKDGNVTGSSDPSEGYQWDDTTPAECRECDWEGTVKDLYTEDETPTEPTEPKTLTREDAIDQLIEERLSNWDSDDIDEALRTGRYGYAEFSNAVLEELWNDFFEEVVTITGQEPEPTIELKKADHDKLTETYKQMLDALKLLQAVKGPVTFEDGWAHLEDGTEICLNDLIAEAEGKE